MRKGDAAQAVGGKQDSAPSAPVWRDSILKADTALEQATTIQRSVQYRMELENEIRVLRAALKEAHAQAGHYQGLHARLSAEKAASVTGYARELACLQTENDTLRLRHRVYKIMAQYYALFVLRIPPRAMAEHRERVLQHVLFQRRKGHTLADIRATEVISGLLAAGDGAAPPENPRPAMDPDTA